ncbi:hypothetical protein Nepgr_026599 [Nepenthes gracilis]|uniref:Uncharacterized protein n=1 Tax=Nepenthes gracilis TaxID=150966 RepID=A0AAD3TA15_NEPGR|nr:hypothetical protein Nepgr_026599 [Nepenthes gracilis]
MSAMGQDAYCSTYNRTSCCQWLRSYGSEVFLPEMYGGFYCGTRYLLSALLKVVVLQFVRAQMDEMLSIAEEVVLHELIENDAESCYSIPVAADRIADASSPFEISAILWVIAYS